MTIPSIQAAILFIFALFSLACTGAPAGTVDMSMSDGGGPKSCVSCPADEVCSDGACQQVPSHCPCPKETYCDLASNSCKRGCTDDTNCNVGEVCDSAARSCMAGCRKDASCGAGFICQAQGCVAGCRGNSDCTAAGQRCNPDTNKCIKACRNQADCATGMTCDDLSGQCVPECPAGNAPCADSQACVQMADMTYGCSSYCRGTPCKGMYWKCSGDSKGPDLTKLRCRKACSQPVDCAADESCALFGTGVIADGGFTLCAKRCDLAGCDQAKASFHPTATCHCDAVTTHLCAESGGGPVTPCVQTDYSYGL